MATDYSMFEGWRVAGNARHVFSRGELVVKDGKWIGKTGRGCSSSVKPMPEASPDADPSAQLGIRAFRTRT